MTIAENTCGCGCSQMTSVTEAQEPCGCGCQCCEDGGQPKPREQEIAELLGLREKVETRLADLEAN